MDDKILIDFNKENAELHPLSDEELTRYARQVILKEVGEEGQKRLLNAKILMVGAGGLGSVALLYLAAAGVGTIGIIDHDEVDLTNLQRQILYNMDDIGLAKTSSAKTHLQDLNPNITINAHRARLNEQSAIDIFPDYDIILDGSDNFETRLQVNKIAVRLKKPLISAAVIRFEGQLATYHPVQGGPCYQCVFPKAPPRGLIPRCDTVGIFGAIAGVMGSLQASEAIKEILGQDKNFPSLSMQSRLLIYDGLATKFQEIQISKNPDCPICRDEKF